MHSKSLFLNIINYFTELDTLEQGPESGDEDSASDSDNADPDPVEHDEEQQHPGNSQRGVTLV